MIRIATEEDFDQIRRLSILNYHETPLAPPLNPLKMDNQIWGWLSAPKTEKIIFLSEKDGHCFGLLVGVITEFFYSSETQAHELMWWVEPEYRKNRDALSLFDAYEYWAKVMGCWSIGVATVNGWQDMTKFYTRRGYSKTETAFRKIL